MNNLTPIDWAVFALSVFMSRAAADVLGPAAVTVVFASIGAGWSLYRIETPLAPRKMLAYITLVIGFSLATTALISQLIALAINVAVAKFLSAAITIPAAWFVAPLALLIAAIGRDWIDAGRWLTERIAAWGRRKTGE